MKAFKHAAALRESGRKLIRQLAAALILLLPCSSYADVWSSIVNDGYIYRGKSGISLSGHGSLPYLQADLNDAVTCLTNAFSRPGADIVNKTWISVFFNNDLPSPIAVSSVKFIIQHQGAPGHGGNMIVHVSTNRAQTQWYTGKTNNSHATSATVPWNDTEQTFEFDVKSIFESNPGSLNDCEILIINRDPVVATNNICFDYIELEVNYSDVSPPVMTTDGGASDIQSGSATLNGEVVAGGPDPQVWIYWGTNDGGTVSSAWNRVESMGTRAVGTFPKSVSGLLANQGYFYRCYGTNIHGPDWSEDVAVFTTLPPVVAFSTASSSGAESVSPAQIGVTLSATSALPVTVYYGISGGTASNLTDYSLPQGSIVIPAGSISGLVSLSVTNDSIDETDETVGVAITNVAGATIGAQSSHTYTIQDDDDAPVVGFSAPSYNAFEDGGFVTLSVSLSAASEKQVSVYYGTVTNTATDPGDYTNVAGSFTWNAGESGSKTFDVLLVDDGASEGVETFFAMLSNAVNCAVGANMGTSTVSLIDDDMGEPVVDNEPGPASVSSNSATMQGTLLSVGGALTEARVFWGPTDGGTNESSWTNNVLVGNYMAVGSFSTNITSLLTNRTYYYRCRATNIYGKGWAPFTTNFYTGPPMVQFTATSSSGPESDTPVLLQLLLATPPVYGVNVSVKYSVRGGTATQGVDYVLATGTATILAGQTGTNISITVTNDTMDETDETIIVAISNAAGAVLGPNTNHTYTIFDDDPQPSIVFTNTPFSVAENGTNAVVFVALERSSVWTVDVAYATADGTAQSSVDYTGVVGHLTWLPGQTGIKSFTVPIIDNILKAGDKWFRVDLSGITNATFGAESSTNVTIKENDYDKPVVTNDGGASNVLWTSAELNGWVSEAYPAATTYIYWGWSDGGVVFGAWSNAVEIGVTQGLFKLKLEGLWAGTTYYYRCYSTNMVGEDWADYTAIFTTRAPVTAGVSNYYVNDNSQAGDLFCLAPGTNTNTGFSRTAPKASVQAVLNDYNLEPGDTIWVDAGVYTGLAASITVTNNDYGSSGSPVVIRGVSGVNGSVLSRASTGSDVITVVNASGGDAGLRFENLRPTGGRKGMYFSGAATAYLTGIDVNDCLVYSNYPDSFGVHFKYFDNPLMSNSVCFQNGNGIDLETCINGTVRGNTIFSNAYHGIRGRGVTNAAISGNDIYDHVINPGAPGRAVLLYNGYAGTVSSNYCHNNYYGVDVGNVNCEVLYNNCSGNTTDGIYSISTNVLIRGNRCGYNTGSGINLAAEFTSQIARNNILVNNSWQINISGANSVGLVENNTLYGGNGLLVRDPLSLTNRSNIIWCDGLDCVAIKLETQPASAEEFKSDYNDIYPTAIALAGDIAGSTIPYFVDWQDISGGDSNSVSLDPLFANPSMADFHVRSTAGSWNNGVWRIDQTNSPCLDRGDPWADFTNEPSYNGLTVNQGAFGNTTEASKSPYPSGAFYAVNVSTQPVAAGRVAVWPPAAAYPTNRQVTVTAISTNDGYMFNAWTGSVNTVSNPFSFYVASNMWFTATFATQTWNIAASAGAGGEINPSGIVTVLQGSDKTFTLTAYPHYSVSNVVVDSISRGPSNSWTFVNVRTNHTIAAEFMAIYWDISASAGAGGQISPQGTVSVPDGSNQVFSILTNAGYAVSNVVVDGTPRGATNSWTFTNVTAVHSISAEFMAAAGPQFTSRGTPYSWLQFYGYSGDMEEADVTDDDKDGAQAWKEYQAGTLPKNSTSVFAVISVDRRPLSNRITWYGTTNSGVYTYFHIYRATNMKTASPWTFVASNLSRSATGTNTWWDTNTPSPGIPFFYKPGLTTTNP